MWHGVYRRLLQRGLFQGAGGMATTRTHTGATARGCGAGEILHHVPGRQSMNTKQHELLEAVRHWSRVLHRHEHGAELAREKVREIMKQMEGDNAQPNNE